MKIRTGIWRFSGPLRFIMLFTAFAYGCLYLVIWGMAWAGNTEIVYGLTGAVSEEPLTKLQIIGGMICMGAFVGAFILIALTTNIFLKKAYREGFFQTGISRALRHLGYSMVLFYLGLTLTEKFLPWLITKNLGPEQQNPIEWFFLDPTLVALLVGLVLLLLSGAMDEACDIDAENKQII